MILGDLTAITVVLMVLVGIVALFAAMGLFARNYIKVPPSQVAIFYGRKHRYEDDKGNRVMVGFRVVKGGARVGMDTRSSPASWPSTASPRRVRHPG